MASIAIQRREEIIEQVSRGAMLKAIATSLGVTPAAISNQLHADPEYRKAREIGAEVRLEEQYDAIVAADDRDDVSRAREGFRAAAWFAEREFPERWGQKQQVTLTVDLGSALQQISERLQASEHVIEGVSVGVSDASHSDDSV